MQSDIHFVRARRACVESGGFSLVEAVIAIAILIILMTAGLAVTGGRDKARRAATDRITGLIEQARTQAITSHSTVALAFAPPGSLPQHKETCAMTLLRFADGWESGSAGPVEAVPNTRWKPLETGVVLLSGGTVGLGNPLDAGTITIRTTTNRTVEAGVHALVFNERGRLVHPPGSAPAMLRIAEGGYRGGVAVPSKRGANGAVPETLIKIGRIVGRAYEFTP